MHKAQRDEVGSVGNEPRDPLGPGFRTPLLISASVGLLVFLVWQFAVYAYVFDVSPDVAATILSLSIALNGALITWVILTPKR